MLGHATAAAAVFLVLSATAVVAQGGTSAPFVAEVANASNGLGLHMAAVQNSVYVLAKRGSEPGLSIVSLNGITSRLSSGRPTADFTGVTMSPSLFRISVNVPTKLTPGAGPGATFVLALDGTTTSVLTGDSSDSDIAAAILSLPTQPDPNTLSVKGLAPTMGTSSWEVQYRHSTEGHLNYSAEIHGAGLHSATLTQLTSAPPPSPAASAQRTAWDATTAVEAVPAVVTEVVTPPSPLADPAATAGPVLAAGIEWVAVGHPTALLNESGVVSLRYRKADGTLGPAGLLIPRLDDVLMPPFQGVYNLTAMVRTPNVWLYDVPEDPGAPLLARDTAGDGASAERFAVTSVHIGPRLGASVAVDGPWLVAGGPWLGHTMAGPLVRPGSFYIVALSPTPGTMEPRAALSVTGIIPNDMSSMGALAGPHPAARAITGAQQQDARCGTTVAIGGGFVAVGCPGLSLPSTAWTSAAGQVGGILILRKSAPNDTLALAETWPFGAPESAVFPMDLRSDASVTQRAAGQPLRAEAVAKSAAWPTVQLLVPTGAEAGLALGSGRGSASFLAVSSRHVAAAVPGKRTVFVWRRRSGRARAFDPASQQTIQLRADATGLALAGSRLVVSIGGPAAGGRAAELFEADALGFFYGEAKSIGGASAAGGPQFGLAATFAVPSGVAGCNVTTGRVPGASVAAAVPLEGADPATSRPSLRLVTTCAGPAGDNASTPVALGLLDVGVSCPSFLAKPASPALGFFPSVANSRSIFTRRPGQEADSSPGECDAAPARPPGAAPFGDAFRGAKNHTAPALALGAGPTAACVLPCDYGHSLASGAQLAACEAHGAWSLLPDEVPNCERMLNAAPASAPAAHGREVAPPEAPGGAGPADVPGLPGASGGGDDPEAVSLVSLRVGHVATFTGPLSSAALGPSAVSPFSILQHPPPSSPDGYPAAALRSVLGAFRAVDGTYSVARSGLPSMPVLAFQSRGPGAGANGSFAVVPEASGGAPRAGTSSFAGHAAAAARAATLASLASAGASRLPAQPPRPVASRRADVNATPVLAAAMESVSASILVPRTELVGLARERFEPSFGGRLNLTRCRLEGDCKASRGDDGVLLRAPGDALGPVTDPLSQWADPAGTLDPLRAPRFRRAPALLVPGLRPPHVRAGAPAPVNRSAPAWHAAVTTGGDLGSPSVGHLALPGAASAPVLRFSPANASLAGPADPVDTAGHLLLDDSDLLGTEALLAPMTWHAGFSDFDVAVQARGGPALGGAPLATTLPLRVCCATGRGREPADERRRRRGPLVTSVRVHLTDAYAYALSSPVSGSGSVSFMDLLLSRLSLRLGNVSAAASLAGQSPRLVPAPNGSDVDGEPAPGVPGFSQRHAAGTAALDVPGASAMLARAPVDASGLAPPGTDTGAAHRDPVTGRYAPWPSGASFDLRISGFGSPDPADATGPCSSLESPHAGPAPAPASDASPGAERTAHVRVLMGSSRTSGSATLTVTDADRLAKVVLRAAGQPLSWFERRRCVAADLRSG